MEYSKIKITKIDAPEKTAFENLAVGDWYESDACWGVCVKLAENESFSMTKRRRFTCSTCWMCRPVNVQIKYR